MYDFKIEAADKPTLYRDLAQALEALIGDEPDAVANMANAAGLIYESLPDVNWVGFYRNVGDELVLGPFQGRPACIRMSFEQRDRPALIRDGELLGVLDIDSPKSARFDEEDEAGLRPIAEFLARVI